MSPSSAFKMIREFKVDTARTCVILGGGPSLVDCDYAAFSNAFTIGTNKTFKCFTPNLLYCMDLSFYDYIYGPATKHMPEDAHIRSLWETCPSTKVFPRPLKRYAFKPDINVVYRMPQKVIATTLLNGIYPGNNVGFGALMLAIALGFKIIHLYGIDLSTNGSRTHCHEGYHDTTIDQQHKFFEHYKKLFEEFAPKIRDAGISVINMNPHSALECFEKQSSYVY